MAFLLLLAAGAAGPAAGLDIRYRGQYTYGHEVNIFCPAINSQCYWLSPDTAPSQRQQLKQIASRNAAQPYEAVCVVVEGEINRDPVEKNRIGFAVDYDGLFTVNRVLGTCGEPGIVTQGDLQHHRWVLESINGSGIPPTGDIPELEFGEQMMVSGDTGCNRFSGRAVLWGERFYIESIRSTPKACPPAWIRIERLFKQVFRAGARIVIDAGGDLRLETPGTVLKYRLFDWRR